MKVMTVVGTRPEIIRLSRIIPLLDQFTDHIFVHTDQNYSYELSEIFYKDLDLRNPNYHLSINTNSLGSAISDIIKKSEKILQKEKPDILLILGDTNSSLFAYMAKRMHIPIYHMEAGNRSFDERTPEEINRRIIDHIADYNLVYTEHSRRHLLSEGLPHNRIFLTGSPLKEVIDYYHYRCIKSDILKKLDLTPGFVDEYIFDTKDFFLASVHREENVDNPENLKKIITIFNNLATAYKYPVIISTHPRTSKLLNSSFVFHPLLKFIPPTNFTDYVKLELNAKCVLSDSGTISEESAILDFPAISLRESFERPESLDSGTILLSGLDPTRVACGVKAVLEHRQHRIITAPSEYLIGDTSWRVLKLILGNHI